MRLSPCSLVEHDKVVNVEHEKQHAHISHDERPDSKGKLRTWWHVDIRSLQGALSLAGAIVLIAGMAWGALMAITISVFDPHIRRIVREEVPAAIGSLLDAAMQKAALPHLTEAKAIHQHLQEQIEENARQTSYNRDEREKMLKQLIANDAIQREEISAMRADLVRLTANVQTLYELLLKIEADGKAKEALK